MENWWNSLNTARNQLGGAGIYTAAIAFGGSDGPGAKTAGNTELYDGTSWTEVNDLNTARYVLGGSWNSNCSLSF